ncbi:ATP-grasp peptide maturase system methyltransferase [Embleya sp. NBC_00896]|uniref:ATP-grasp peptide maturase system methyltransferase n=1 Tax=Embleya sp. NBC_00896 TaxID=2975961 RepID=UPI0038645CA5|nr:ATP-grasp peptide maturase system methyltransferase [Embleya sp. NBC_00896]
MTDQSTPDAIALRRRLAHALVEAGHIHTPAWRTAVEAVPREAFACEWFTRSDTDQGTLWTPVTGDAATLDTIYTDVTLVTQLDEVRPSDAPGPVYGSPTSSSTLPSLVVGMLEDLRVGDTDRVLEIGTGTGYSTALLTHRLGDDRVTSIEVDPDTAARAAASLKEAGFRPRLVVGDGLDGAPEHAPYDGIIATCAVRRVPQPWLDQAAPGATILTNMTGWLYAYGQARLTVVDADNAVGEFLPGSISFMTARRHAAPPMDDHAALTATGPGRPTSLGPEVLSDWTGRFVLQGALPTTTHRTTRIGDGPYLNHLIAVDGSFATLLPQSDGTWNVREGGAVKLWEQAEKLVGAWRDAGSPSTEMFRFRIVSGEQTIHLPGTDLAWNLPGA